MSSLITELRGMVEAGTADYTVNSAAYWSDDHLQDVLDLHRRDVVFEPLSVYPTQGTASNSLYQDYRSAFGFYEQTTGGSAIFYLQDSTGAYAGTANWTADYRRGVILFGADQAGTAYYLTGRSFDLDAAAADVWRRKASHYANSFDFSTDNHSISRSQVYAHCLQMAEFFESKGGDAISTVQLFRGDMD